MGATWRLRPALGGCLGARLGGRLLLLLLLCLLLLELFRAPPALLSGRQGAGSRGVASGNGDAGWSRGWLRLGWGLADDQLGRLGCQIRPCCSAEGCRLGGGALCACSGVSEGEAACVGLRLGLASDRLCSRIGDGSSADSSETQRTSFACCKRPSAVVANLVGGQQKPAHGHSGCRVCLTRALLAVRQTSAAWHTTTNTALPGLKSGRTSQQHSPGRVLSAGTESLTLLVASRIWVQSPVLRSWPLGRPAMDAGQLPVAEEGSALSQVAWPSTSLAPPCRAVQLARQVRGLHPGTSCSSFWQA